jgi:drug/metabolite transporter (DMT)-like permease
VGQQPAPPGRRPIGLADALLMMVTVVWGLNFPGTKVMRLELTTAQLLGLRWPAFALLLLIIALIVERRLRVPRRDLAAFFLIAIPGVVINQALWVQGLGPTTASRSALILATAPVFANLFTPAFGGRPLGWLGWVGIGVALLGIMLVKAGPALIGPGTGLLGRLYHDLFRSPASVGDLEELAAAVCIGFYTAAARPYVRCYSPLLFTTYTVGIGALIMLPFVVRPLADLDFAAVSVRTWGWMGYTIVFAGVIGFICWFTGVARIGPARTAIYQTVMPVVSVAGAVPLLGDRLTAIQILGAAITLLGVFVARSDKGSGGPELPSPE